MTGYAIFRKQGRSPRRVGYVLANREREALTLFAKMRDEEADSVFVTRRDMFNVRQVEMKLNGALFWACREMPTRKEWMDIGFVRPRVVSYHP